MNRWGFDLSEISTLIKELKTNKGIVIGSIYSHLASSENINDDEFTKSQINALIRVKALFQKEFDYPIKSGFLRPSPRCREIPISGIFLHLSKKCSPANQGG